MNIQAFWDAILRQDAQAIREYFRPDAWVNWHNTNEHFTVEEFIRANCEYPGEWAGEVEQIITTDTHIITATHVYSKDGDQSFHATSFIRVVEGKIASIEEYWGDDGPAPFWRQEKQIGTKIRGENLVYQSLVNRTPIDKGWSGDQKYFAMTAAGEKYLLRISSPDRLERKRREYEKMKEVAQLGIPMCLPVEFGTCPEGAYSIQSWIDGEDAERLVIAMDADRQYRYGLDAGRILAKIHTIPAPADAPEWESRFNAKIDRKIAMYEKCPIKYENSQSFLTYIAQNRHLLAGRPQTYQHGDYHIGNMMIDRNGILNIIDFDRDDFGDPWEEFNRIVWCAQTAPAFASGMVDGYFDGEVPMAFWKLLALYICSNTLSSLPWAVPLGQKQIQVMRNQAAQVLQWYDGMKNVVPSWYQTM